METLSHDIRSQSQDNLQQQKLLYEAQQGLKASQETMIQLQSKASLEMEDIKIRQEKLGELTDESVRKQIDMLQLQQSMTHEQKQAQEVIILFLFMFNLMLRLETQGDRVPIESSIGSSISVGT